MHKYTQIQICSTAPQFNLHSPEASQIENIFLKNELILSPPLPYLPTLGKKKKLTSSFVPYGMLVEGYYQSSTYPAV